MPLLKIPQRTLVFQTVFLAKRAKGNFLLQQFHASNRCALQPVARTISFPSNLPDLLERITDAVISPELELEDDIVPSPLIRQKSIPKTNSSCKAQIYRILPPSTILFTIFDSQERHTFQSGIFFQNLLVFCY
jgi:hypothetical protein